MSRTRNKHHASWNYAKREAKFYSKKNRRNYGKKLLNNIKNTDPEDNELPVDVPKNAGKGDMWIYD